MTDKPTIKMVKEALNDAGPNMDPERFRALAASLDGMVLVPSDHKGGIEWMVVELTKIRAAEVPHLCVENFAPELYRKLLTASEDA